MNSKMSFFNKALYLSDMKRYWWIGALYTLLIFMGCVIPLYESPYQTYGSSSFTYWGGSAFVFSSIFSIGAGVILMSFLNSNGSVSMMHSLPIERKCIFSTKIISALTLLMIPVFIASIALLGLSLDIVYNNIPAIEVAKWLYGLFCYTIFFLSFTVFVGMMTGNSVGNIVFTLGFIFLPLFLTELLEEIIRNELHGFSEMDLYRFLDYIYLDINDIVTKKYWYVYPAFSVVFTSGAYVLYRKRKSEAHGEVIAFKGLKPVFVGIVAIIASGISYMYSQGIFNVQNLFTMLPLGIIGTVTAHMISKKSLDFKGSIKPVIVYLIAAICFIGAIHFDITGYIKRVPDSDKVESVSVEFYSYFATVQFPNNVTFSSEENIKAVSELHKNLTETKTDDKNLSTRITYKLKNGSTLCREYYINLYEHEEYLKPLLETEEFLKEQFEILKPLQEHEITYIDVVDKMHDKTYFFDDKDFEKLLTAIKKDMLSYSYENIVTTSSPAKEIFVSYEYYSHYAKSTEHDKLHFRVYDDCVNTLNTLKEIGFYEEADTE